MWWTRLPIAMLAVVLAASSALPGAEPIVDGSDSVSSASSLIVVREQYFDTADLSALGLLDSAGPVDYLSPDPPPWASASTSNVQSLLIRAGYCSGAGYAATITFSPGVQILGVVSDVVGTTGYLWGAPPDTDPNSQLVQSDAIFGVGMDYTALTSRAWEVLGDIDQHMDSFSVDPVSNTLTLSAKVGYSSGADDLRVIIAYEEPIGPSEFFDVTLTEGDGLYVGAGFLGSGQEFFGVALTPEPATLGLFALGVLAWVRRRR
jgi:hypothetical protein